MSNDSPPDLDEIIANDNAERALWAEADFAFRVDPEFAIEVAGAARIAAEKQARIDAAERAGLASDDPAEVTRTERTAARRRWRRSSALASMAAYDSI